PDYPSSPRILSDIGALLHGELYCAVDWSGAQQRAPTRTQAKHARRESSPTRAFAHTWRQKPVSPIRTIGHAFGTCKQVSEIRVRVMPRTPTPVDIRKIAQPASMYDWQEGPPQQ